MSSRELEKFTRYFLQKAVQVIVQSRLGGERIKTNSSPKGNDWFNIAISDIRDVSDQTKKCIELLGLDKDASVISSSDTATKSIILATRWRFCCEISIKTTEGETMVLEYWFITNEPSELSGASSPKAQQGVSLAIFDIYNRMSLLLKSLISMTRATPAYKLSSSGQSADSYVICYRVYQADNDFESILKSKSKEALHYSREIKLGSIICDTNTLSASFCYRKDMTPCSKSNLEIDKSPQLLPVKNDHFQKDNSSHRMTEKVRDSNSPLIAAFASSPASKYSCSSLCFTCTDRDFFP